MTLQEMNSIIWKDIVGYEGLYQVSSNGLVKSLDRTRYCTRGGKKILFCEKSKFLTKNVSRYERVALSKDGITKHFSVHRLVAIAFIPNIENKPQVNHIDGNRLNNNHLNLEWVTQAENINHAYQNNLIDKIKCGKHRINVTPANAKLVLDLQTGIFYSSSKEAEIAKNIKPNTLRSYLNGARKHIKRFDLIFC